MIANNQDTMEHLTIKDNEQEKLAAETFWDSHTTSILERLLTRAGYNAVKKTDFLTWYQTFVVPSLGRKPVNGVPFFDSFMNDDFSPVEFSWEHQEDGAIVSIGFEPIGDRAGRPHDPFNQVATEELLERLSKRYESVDLNSFQSLRAPFFVDSNGTSKVFNNMALNDHMTTNTVSCELNPEFGSPVLRACFWPAIRSLDTDKSSISLVHEAVINIENSQRQLERHFEVVNAFLDRHKRVEAPRFEAMSVDCTDPLDSKVTLYIRKTQSSLRSITNFFTLGNHLSGPHMRTAIEKLTRLWFLLTGLQALDHVAPSSNHRTAGIVFSYELRPGEQDPAPKVYIPVKHYCKSDMDIAMALEIFFGAQGWSYLAENYFHLVQEIL